MDGRNLEPCARLHKGQPRLQALLCGKVRRAFPRSEGTSLRTRLRPASRSKEARRASALERAENDIRQLHERSVPRRRTGHIYREGGADDAACELAHVSGPDEALRAPQGAVVRPAPSSRKGCSYMVGCVSGEP